MISGTLLLDKQIGLTSRQEVNKISKKFGERKAGHIGTLDPFADGLLIVLLGRATKISPFIESMDKKYLATLKLGKKTNTGDLTGEVIEEKKVPKFDRDFIEKTLASFKGKYEQLPPMFSALKVNGKELYKYAREGQEIERKIREVNIYNITLISFNEDEIVFLSHVSKGTYIRTLGEDIAERLGTVGTLTKLTRVAIGPYSLEMAKKSDDASLDDLRSTKQMLEHMETIILNDEDAKKAINGVPLKLDAKNDLVLVSDINDVIAIYKMQSNGVYSCLRGLR